MTPPPQLRHQFTINTWPLGRTFIAYELRGAHRLLHSSCHTAHVSRGQSQVSSARYISVVVAVAGKVDQVSSATHRSTMRSTDPKTSQLKSHFHVVLLRHAAIHVLTLSRALCHHFQGPAPSRRTIRPDVTQPPPSHPIRGRSIGATHPCERLSWQSRAQARLPARTRRRRSAERAPRCTCTECFLSSIRGPREGHRRQRSQPRHVRTPRRRVSSRAAAAGSARGSGSARATFFLGAPSPPHTHDAEQTQPIRSTPTAICCRETWPLHHPSA